MKNIVNTDIELIREAIGQDTKRIAHFYGKSPSWVLKQTDPTYLNFWTNTKKWLSAFNGASWAKVELFKNDFELFIRELRRKHQGLVLPFPIEEERELIFIRNRIDGLLGV